MRINVYKCLAFKKITVCIRLEHIFSFLNVITKKYFIQKICIYV